MSLFKNKYRIESTRLQGYDYSKAGAYFITIVTYKRLCLFGKIENGRIELNDAGKIALHCWLDIPNHFPNAQLDEFIIMPNHVHGILILNDTNIIKNENKYQKIIPKSIGSIVRGYKIGVTKWFRNNSDIFNVWQNNYYEHIIRNDVELSCIRDYILNNAKNWQKDENFI